MKAKKDLSATVRFFTLAFATAAALTSVQAAGAASRYSVQVKCKGSLDAYVLDWHNQGLALYVYDQGELIHADWADERVIEDNARMTRIGYSTGSVVDGGANLRIRTQDSRFPNLEGTAHLTINGANELLKCSKF